VFVAGVFVAGVFVAGVFVAGVFVAGVFIVGVLVVGGFVGVAVGVGVIFRSAVSVTRISLSSLSVSSTICPSEAANFLSRKILVFSSISLICSSVRSYHSSSQQNA